jgi:hypothetical protein
MNADLAIKTAAIFSRLFLLSIRPLESDMLREATTWSF